MTIPQLLRIGAVCEGAGDGLALRTLLPRIPAVEPQNQRQGLERDVKEAAGVLLKAAMKAYDPQPGLSVADAEYDEDVSGEYLAVASE